MAIDTHDLTREDVAATAVHAASKTVTGRFSGGPDPEPIEFLADDTHGLYGFRSPAADATAADGP